MASITKLNNGKYKIVVTTYIADRISEDGKLQKKQKRICETYSPKATTPKRIKDEVEEYAREFEKRIHNGKYFNGERTTFAAVVDAWDKEYASHRENLTENVYEGYMSILRKTFIPVIGDMPISDIKAKHLHSIINGLVDNGRTLETAKRHFYVCRNVFNYAYQLEIIENNPCDRFKGYFKKRNDKIEDSEEVELDTEKYHCFDAQQAIDFLSYLEQPHTTQYKAHTRVINGISYNVTGYEESHSVSTQYQAYFYLAIYGGFRRSELIALNWTDISFKDKTVKIQKATTKTKGSGQYQKGTKTKAGRRTITLPDKCFEILHKWQLEEKELCIKLGSAWQGYRGKDFDRNPVFIQIDSGKRMNVDTPSGKFRELLEYYNNDHPENHLPKIRLHDLRHTCASLLVAEGVDIAIISKRLGHSKISVTLDIYSHAYNENDKKASEALGRLLG